MTAAGSAGPGDAERRGIFIGVDDPRTEDVRALLETHLAFCHSVTPIAHAYAMDVDRLSEPEVTSFSARDGKLLVGVGALKRLDESHAELKSMHTSEAARGRGVGRAIAGHILGFARAQGYRRVSLETGTMDAFASARALYARMGFETCEPFGDYARSPYNTWMTMSLSAPAAR